MQYILVKSHVFIMQIQMKSNTSRLFSNSPLFTNSSQLYWVTNNANSTNKLKISCEFMSTKLLPCLLAFMFCTYAISKQEKLNFHVLSFWTSPYGFPYAKVQNCSTGSCTLDTSNENSRRWWDMTNYHTGPHQMVFGPHRAILDHIKRPHQ